MDATKKKIIGFYFSPEETTFHIIVRIKDVPGALANVLELLKNRASIISCISYNVEGGGAVWSGFVKSLSDAETAAKLKKLLKGSALVEECQVDGSDQGLIVDNYHSGLEYGPGRPGIMMPSAGISRINKKIIEVYGSGGEALLFGEGQSLGESSGGYLNHLLGSGRLDWKIRGLAGMYSSLGWGNPTLEIEKPEARYILGFRDCFECFERDEVRKECTFLRGHLTGTVSTISGSRFVCKEVKCCMREDAFCEFQLTREEV